ncbi:alanine racemase, partial [Laribacter hongkongensis]
MTRPIRATLDLAAIRHNYQQAKACSPESFAFAVIKADAYGHGYEQVAAALAGLADGFALINIEQARTLREAGLRQPILLLEGCFDRAELE